MQKQLVFVFLVGSLLSSAQALRRDLNVGALGTITSMNASVRVGEDSSLAPDAILEELKNMAAQSDEELLEGLNKSGKIFPNHVAIMGAGPVGLYLANRLVLASRNVVILEDYYKPGAYPGKKKNKKSINPGNDYFVRDQVLLINDNKYRSIQNLHHVLTSASRKKLRDNACGTDALPDAVYNMNCGFLDLVRHGTPSDLQASYFSIPIRVLQSILYDNLLELSGSPVHQRIDGRDVRYRAGRAQIVFTNRGPSWVDHNGKIGFFRKEWGKAMAQKLGDQIVANSRVEVRLEDGGWYRATVLDATKKEYTVCIDTLCEQNLETGKPRNPRVITSVKDIQLIVHASEETKILDAFADCFPSRDAELTVEKFPECYKRRFETNLMSPKQAEKFFRFFGVKEQTDPKKPPNGFTLSHWVQLEQSILIVDSPDNSYLAQNCLTHGGCLAERKPRTIVCADGANGACSTMVLSGAKQQPIQQEKSSAFEAFAMLFLLRDVPEKLRTESNAGRLTGSPWPGRQHRFRIFTSRQEGESWYVAATLTKREFEKYKFVCTLTDKEGCPGINEMWDSQDLNIGGIARRGRSKGTSKAQQVKIKEVHEWLKQLFANALNFASVPSKYHKTLRRGAAVSAFPIKLGQANEFMRIEGTQLRAAVGDAAASVHFFSGSGVNIGLKSAHLFYEMFTSSQDRHQPHDFLNFVVQQAQEFKNSITSDVRTHSRFDQVNKAKYDALTSTEYGGLWPDIVSIYNNLYNTLFLYEHLIPSYEVIHQSNYPHVGERVPYGALCGTSLEYNLAIGHRPATIAVSPEGVVHNMEKWLTCPSTNEEAVAALQIRLEVDASTPSVKSRADKVRAACARSSRQHTAKIKARRPNMQHILKEAAANKDRDTICALYEAWDDVSMHQCERQLDGTEKAKYCESASDGDAARLKECLSSSMTTERFAVTLAEYAEMQETFKNAQHAKHCAGKCREKYCKRVGGLQIECDETKIRTCEEECLSSAFTAITCQVNPLSTL